MIQENENGNNTFPAVTIPGVDQQTGLALYNDEFDLYLIALRSFAPNALKVLEKLRTVSAETLSSYAIQVHGLKSICTNIGAEKVRKAAQQLEIFAKAGDLDEVLTRNNAFLEEAGQLIKNVETWLAELDGKNPKPLLSAPDRLLLTRLATYCEEYNMDGIDEIMDTLERSNYEQDASLIIWLREKITELDFSAIVSRLAQNKEKSEC